MPTREGQQLGDYRLTSLLGQGGFGDVYLGEHLHEHTPVVVKVLHARLTDERDLRAFINEARAIRLQHPHIVPVLDFGIAEDGTPFLVMAYASHGTLRTRYPKGTLLPLDTIVGYVRQVASALQYAHDHRLIHRDVKPENMLLSLSNVVWLSDFGLTTVAHSTRTLAAESGAGTLPYMAPEQLQGKARLASDQYALGIVVYEWLCGERPFQGTIYEIALQHSLMTPPSLCARLPMLSAKVEQVVLTALAKDYRQRFASVQAFATALEQAILSTPSPESDSGGDPRLIAGPLPDQLVSANLVPDRDPRFSAGSPSSEVLTVPDIEPSPTAGPPLDQLAAEQPIILARPRLGEPFSPADHTASPSSTQDRKTTFWNVPMERNPFFTGREGVLDELHRELSKDNRAVLGQVQAISGLGGIGKTQTAVEYAYRHRDTYRAVLWSRAETVADLQAGFADIARQFGLPEAEARDPDETVRAVQRWLATNTGWLLILDNADHPDLLRPFLPQQVRGHLLLTSRTYRFDELSLAAPLALDTLSQEEALAFLYKRTGRTERSATEREAARHLVEELGCLPLALEQCGAYLLAKQARFQDYLTSYRTQRLAVLQKERPRTGNYPASVATTWTLNVAEVEQVPAAFELLCLSAFLGPDDIPLELFTNGIDALSPQLASPLARVQEDPLVLDELLEPLARYALIRRDIEAYTCSIHRLVQEVLKDSMSAELQWQWAERAVRLVNASFPLDETPPWTTSQRLLPHALVCAEHVARWDSRLVEAAYLLQCAGVYFWRRGQYAAAEPLLQQALTIFEDMKGPEHPNTATSLNHLAILYGEWGKFEQAELLLQRALTIREQVLGPERPETADSLNALALLYGEWGKFEQVEPLFRRALAIREQVLGPEHPDTATSLNDLARLYGEQGKYEQAEPLLQRALAIREQVLGSEHLDTAQSLNILALLYYELGRYEQAELLQRRALAIREQVLGPEHPDTATSLGNLALLYHAQGKYEQAELLQRRALAIYEKMLGSEHLDTAQSLNDLADLYYEQGKYEQAEPLLQRALAIWEQVLGPQHPAAAQSLNVLALLYHEQGRYEQAELLCRRALTIRETVLGLQHPDTATSLGTLANLYKSQGQLEQAERLCQRALAIQEKVLGPQHPKAADSLNTLATFYHDQGKFEQAEPLYRRALTIREQVLGPEHPKTRAVRDAYADLHRGMQ